MAHQISLSELNTKNRSNQRDNFGLLAFRGYLQKANWRSCRKVEIELGPVSKDLEPSAVFVDAGDEKAELTFHVMSHLIPNGLHQLKVQLLLDDGQRIGFPIKQLNVLNEGALAGAVGADLKTFGSPIIFGRIVDSSLFPYQSGTTRAWFDEAAPDVPLSLHPVSNWQGAEDHLRRWGFCVLPEMLPLELIERFKSELINAIDSGRLDYKWGSSDRIRNSHHLPAGREIWLYPPVLQFLAQHFRDVPCACQTLTYINGSEQQGHQDTIHLTPYPAGYMSGVWIALQDVEENSGELFIYPGSQMEPRLRAAALGLAKVDADYSSYAVFSGAIDDLVQSGRYEMLKYRPKAGEILVWHENLIHGGSPRNNSSRQRLSIVSHYFARGAVGYYDSRGEAATLETLPETVVSS